MKVLVTGAKGFVGKNICLTLKSLHLQSNHPLANEPIEVLEYDLDNSREDLQRFVAECDFVYHLAGINRPKDPSEFKTGNTVFTEDILERLEERSNKEEVRVPVLLSSSTQAALDNDYGRSKKAAEDAVFAYGEKTGAPVYVYRFANVFGKWCRPNYNSAVSTWCYNLAHDLPIVVRDQNATVTLIYIDDLVNALIRHLVGGDVPAPRTILSVEPAYTKTLCEITDLIKSFHAEPSTLQVPDQADGFVKKLYATYLSYLPEDKFSYPLTMHCDTRGSFTEILHTAERGQVSVNISKPGITKGQHWHHTKHEKFCVVYGRGLIQFRKMDDAIQTDKSLTIIGSNQAIKQPPIKQFPDIIEYHVSGDKLEVVRIPPGYTHNIINEGDTDMVTLMWANEVFVPMHPDTYAEKV